MVVHIDVGPLAERGRHHRRSGGARSGVRAAGDGELCLWERIEK